MKNLWLLVFCFPFFWACEAGTSPKNLESKKEKPSTEEGVPPLEERIIGQWEKMMEPEYIRINEDGTFGRYPINRETRTIDLERPLETANWKVVKNRLELSYSNGDKRYLELQMHEYIDEDFDDFLVIGEYDAKKYPNRKDFENEFSYMRSETEEDRERFRELMKDVLDTELVGTWALEKKEELQFIFKEDGSFLRKGEPDSDDFYQLPDLPTKGKWILEEDYIIVFVDEQGEEFTEMIYWHTTDLFYIGDIYEDILPEYKGVDDFMLFNGWKRIK
jgi:hypothetical protein